MRRIRYLVASSLDGFIAGPDGETEWITADPEVDFAAIWAQFDTLLMGRATYDAGRRRLGENAFAGRTCIVFSRTLKPQDHPRIKLMSELSTDWIHSLKEQPGKDIWLMGGGNLFRSFVEAGFVDMVEVNVLPVMLGNGLPLLPSTYYLPTDLKLIRSNIFKSGRVSLGYEVIRRSQ